MGEKSEVQNLTEADVAKEPLDASPPASTAGQVQQGEPKQYPEDAQKSDDPYAGGEPAAD